MNIVYKTGFFIDAKNLFSAPLKHVSRIQSHHVVKQKSYYLKLFILSSFARPVETFNLLWCAYMRTYFVCPTLVDFFLRMEWILITFSLKNRSYRAFSFHSKYIYFCISLSKILTKLTTPSSSHITYVKMQSPSKTIKKLYIKKLPLSNMLQVSMLHNHNKSSSVLSNE